MLWLELLWAALRISCRIASVLFLLGCGLGIWCDLQADGKWQGVLGYFLTPGFVGLLDFSFLMEASNVDDGHIFIEIVGVTLLRVGYLIFHGFLLCIVVLVHVSSWVLSWFVLPSTWIIWLVRWRLLGKASHQPQKPEQDCSDRERALYNIFYHNRKYYKIDLAEPGRKAPRIRLLRLQPGDFGDKLECRIQRINLDDEQHATFWALSYAWGEIQALDEMAVDGREGFQISVSLSRALRHIRLQNAEVLLWVDLISINQFNDRERSKQVQLMQRIYRSAEGVYVWLGECAAFEKLTSLCGCHRLKDSSSSFKRLPLAYRYAGLLETSDASSETMWWRRVWTIQETILPGRVVVVIGAHKFSWAMFEQMIDDTNSLLSQSKIHFTNIVRLRRLWQERHRRGPSGAGFSLAESLQMSRRYVASNPRDKIYALLGLLSTEAQSQIAVDYDIKIDKLDYLVSKILLTEQGSLDAMCSGTWSQYDTPSWALRITDVPGTAMHSPHDRLLECFGNVPIPSAGGNRSQGIAFEDPKPGVQGALVAALFGTPLDKVRKEGSASLRISAIDVANVAAFARMGCPVGSSGCSECETYLGEDCPAASLYHVRSIVDGQSCVFSQYEGCLDRIESAVWEISRLAALDPSLEYQIERLPASTSGEWNGSLSKTAAAFRDWEKRGEEYEEDMRRREWYLERGYEQAWWRKLCRRTPCDNVPPSPMPPQKPPSLRSMCSNLASSMKRGATVIVTKTGLVGLAVGDVGLQSQILVVPGTSLLVVVECKQTHSGIWVRDEWYEPRGSAWFPGLMDGEIMEAHHAGKFGMGTYKIC